AFAPGRLAGPAGRTPATTSAAAMRASTAGSSSAYYAPETSVITKQPGATGAVIPQKRSSKPMLLIAVAIMVLAGVMVWAFQKYGGKAQSNMGGGETNTPSVPDGMIPIPEGSFMMGRNLTDQEKNFTIKVGGGQVKIFSYDWPAHEEPVKAFYMDKTEVSNREYAEFVKATGHAPPPNWEGPMPKPNALQI